MTTLIENCDENSVIKVLPNAKAFVNKNCEFVVDICHNYTTQNLYPITANLVVYSHSMVIQNNTTPVDCKSYKKIKNREIVKMISTLSGLKDCEKYKQGVVCKNTTIMKLKDSVRSIGLIRQTSTNMNQYQIVEKIVFENGAVSCIKSQAEGRKY